MDLTWRLSGMRSIFLNNQPEHRCLLRSSSHQLTCLPRTPARLAECRALCCSTTAVGWSSRVAVVAVGRCARSPLLPPTPVFRGGALTPSRAWTLLMMMSDILAVVASLPTAPNSSLPLPPALPSLICPSTSLSVNLRSTAHLLLKTVCPRLPFQLQGSRRVHPRRGSQLIRQRPGLRIVPPRRGRHRVPLPWRRRGSDRPRREKRRGR